MNPYDREILLICKNKTNLSFALNYLGKQGYRVDGAVEHISALKKIHQLKYDLVIFLDKIEEKEQDYIRNMSLALSFHLQFLDFTDPIRHLPALLNRPDQEKN